MSIIHEALKKAGVPPAPSARRQEGEHPRRPTFNWGPLFVIAVLVLISGPLLAPMFASPFRRDTVRFDDFSTAAPPAPQTLESNSGNRKAQFVIEEVPPFATPSAGTVLETPPLDLTGIVFSADRSYAIVNGQVVKVGDKIQGAEVKSITSETLTLEYEGRQIQLGISR